MATADSIAIVGMAARLPGADNIGEFWANLVAGRDCLTDLPDDELLRHHEDPQDIANPRYVRRRPVLTESDCLDHELFGMTPREAELRDPQYRILLETVYGTLEHAGYDPAHYSGQIGLFAATNINRYRYDYIEANQDVVDSVGYEAIYIHNNPDYLTTYISYKLGLRGPSATVLTACSSSLVAVHMAMTSILAGDCDMAMAGGVDIEFPFHRGYVPIPGAIAAMDGVVRSFDANSTGTNFGDGVGVVLLKPLSAALRDNDTIYATILGSAINNDGSRKVGYTAPSVSGQSECILKALRRSGVDPRDISYVEAHGTGTRVGDPIELAGLSDAYRSASAGPLPAQYCPIGSVKSNIGHLGQAAGVAALIKTTLALHHRQIPPSINMSTPNPEVDWANSPFYVNTELRDWPAEPGRPRRAGVSSFGIGGTNSHVIVEESPTPAAGNGYRRATEILTWSAMNETAESQLRDRLATHFAELADERFGDTAYTLRVGRSGKPVRAALAAVDAADAAAGLRDTTRVLTWDGVPRDLVFALPGQGAQHPGMCRELYDHEPAFRQGCDAAFEVLEPLLGFDLRALWMSSGDPKRLAETEVAQPLLYVFEYTLAHCLMHWGVSPGMLIGHSLGELVAGAVSGVFGFEDGLRAVATRARVMHRMPRGRMLAVAAGPEEITDLVNADVALATINGPRQVVLAGPEGAIDEAAAVLTARAVACKVLATSHAFHSPAMADAAVELEKALGELRLSSPRIPIISAATGEVISDDQATTPGFWARQLVEPVNFDSVATTVFANGPTTVVEVGSGITLAPLLRGRADRRESQSRILSAIGREGAEPAFARTLAQLWVDGVPVTYWRHDEGRGYRRVAAPGYPYQRRRHWLEVPKSDGPQPATETRTDVSSSAEAVEPETPTAAGRWRMAELEWVRDPSPVMHRPGIASGSAVLLTSARGEGRAAQMALQRAGYRTVRVVDSRTDGDTGRLSIDPTDPQAWLSVLDKAAGGGAEPVVIAHAALLAAPARVDLSNLDEQLESGLYSLAGALKAAVTFQRRHGGPIRVMALGSGLVDVTGGPNVNPASASVLGLLRTAELENPALSCYAIDVTEAVAEHVLSDTIARPRAPLVAVRGATRWLPRLKPLPPREPGLRLRHRGTYLVTGGLGGIGLVVARSLAETGYQPNIALLGRTPLDELADRAAVQAELETIADAGAEVADYAGDVGDPEALAAVVDEVQRRFGPVNGVVHSAGIAGGGLMELRDIAAMRRVLHPKAAGTLAIEEVFADRAPLDFLLLFSSTAGLSGLYGSADYAAANAFLDAHSLSRVADQRHTVSVQWAGWAEVGMLARSSSAPVALAKHHVRTAAIEPSTGPAGDDDVVIGLDVVRTPGQDWEFDEHVFDGTPVLPGTSLLELAVLGARAVRGGWPVELTDLVFLAPVIGGGPRQLRVVARPVGNTHRIIVQSRPVGGGTWTEHATGTARTPDPVEEPDLAAIAEQLPTSADSPLADWIDFGGRWETITEVRGADGERLARLVLPDPYHPDLAEHPVHPAIVDVAAGVLTDLAPGRQYAPFIYRKVLVLAPLTADVRVHARFASGAARAGRPVDFDIYDSATGRLLIRMESFAMREIAPGQFGAGRTEAPSADPQAHQPPPTTLLPDEGAAIFQDLLNGECPPVVLVDMRDLPLEVPGIGWAGEQAPMISNHQPAATAIRIASGAGDRDSGDGDGEEAVTALRRLWSASLGVADIGLDDDFFELGGNSLAAVQLTSRINAHFGTSLGAGALFDANTVRLLAAELKGPTAR
ncbi:SDR family NAD(P)-dependent oxidoreductase [Nonomuraea sp. NPDC050786]|uniref:SDR family NAD(P)-dependent oxidoreductase n=1 Tax=Nonomuraea sp. NPDC050786 TaxID=3154840 RepID=UPI0033E936A9